MANTRFSRINWIEDPAAILKNGTGGSAPARDEVTPYVMENAMLRDRYTFWKNSGGLGMQVDFDLTGAGLNRSVGVAALLGHRPTSATGSGIGLADVSYMANGGAYPGGPWTSLGSIVVPTGTRDAGIVAAGNVSARYIRFDLTVNDAFTLGRFFIGKVDDDLGTIYGPGASRSVELPRSENVSVGGIPSYTWLGDSSFRFTYSFPAVLSSIVSAKLEALARLKQTVVYVDEDGVFREVLITAVSREVVFKGPSQTIVNVSLEMTQLP